MRSMPYFDEIIRRFTDDPDSELATAFARHVHWGYYTDPDPDDSLPGYLAAAEAMTDQMCRLAGVTHGDEVLDVGCGFGGTIAHLDEQVEAAGLTGLNIDGRAARPGPGHGAGPPDQPGVVRQRRCRRPPLPGRHLRCRARRGVRVPLPQPQAVPARGGAGDASGRTHRGVGLPPGRRHARGRRRRGRDRPSCARSTAPTARR